MKILELKGYKSYRALNAFHALMFGLKMLPSYHSESYEQFFSRIDSMPEVDQKKMIAEAAKFVNLEREELEAIVCFATDKNGVPYTSENIKSLSPVEIHQIIVEVCYQVCQIKIDMVTDSEKKN